VFINKETSQSSNECLRHVCHLRKSGKNKLNKKGPPEKTGVELIFD
jgi:hypothetical protein